MFVRPCWKPTSPQDALELIEQHPWALLLSNGLEVPYATNLPLLLDRSSKVGETHLLGHIARGNEHAEKLADAQVLAVFEGPWTYVTASWYPRRDMPSTFYYTAVHCTGTVEMMDERGLDAHLEDLTVRMESPITNGWRTNEIPRSEMTRRFPAITGFRIRVSKVEAKFKLGQDEPIKDALAVAEELEQHDASSDRAVAALIRKHNLLRMS
ncbi:MAG TPA: FMN-binding negative transcriptional regulator [Terracidiphilus sp.]|jgi:transcriptional regulator|nr:FMN-binding negative transcriptional regulator [Terracidiphilus sp.]